MWFHRGKKVNQENAVPYVRKVIARNESQTYISKESLMPELALVFSCNTSLYATI